MSRIHASRPLVRAAAAIAAAAAVACTDASAPTPIGPALRDDASATAEPGTMASVPAPALARGPSAARSPNVPSAPSFVTTASTTGGLQPVLTLTGKLSLSVDGLGTNDAAGGTIQVEKPAGGTVRKAYLVAATTPSGSLGTVRIDGAPVTWSQVSRSAISISNSLADVTAMVAPKLDAAAAGRVNFTITEQNSSTTDGEILAVVFDDPAQAQENTVVLLFGSQKSTGDDFFVTLASPLDKSVADLKLDMSLGISFGFQPGGQFSTVDVGGTRVSSSAGGQDDGAGANGALLTVGGLDDSNANPSPFASATSVRTDDELYSLIPYVADGATQIAVRTANPSGDDNIFFSAFFLTVKAAVTTTPSPNQAPVAAAGGPYAGSEGGVIRVSGAASADADGDALTYAWDLNNDGTYGDAADAALDASGSRAAAVAASRTFPDNGSYTVGLKASDPAGLSSTATAGVTVANVAPTVQDFTLPSSATLAGNSVVVPITGVTFSDPAGLTVDAPFTTAIQCGNNTSADAAGQCTYSASEVGLRTVTVTVTDKDGGRSAAFGKQVRVVYDWSNFFQPVANAPILNTVKAGQGIPLKFSLGADYGLAILAAGYPISKPMQCTAASGTDPVEETVTAGGSSLTYDALTGQYIYVWKSDKAWAGSCRQLTVRLADGTEHVANFQFTR